MNIALGFFAALVLGLVVLAGVLLVGGRGVSRTLEFARSFGAFAVGAGATGVVTTALGVGSGRLSRILAACGVGAVLGLVSAWLGRPAFPGSGSRDRAEQDARR